MIKCTFMKPILFTLLFVSLAFVAFATAGKKQIIITLIPPGGYPAQTTVYFDFGVTPLYSASQDAPEVFGTNPGEPSIYSITSDNVFCAINGFSPLLNSAIVPLGIKSDTTGNFVFTASTLSNFDSTSIIQLEDRQLNIFTNLRTNPYTAAIADTGLTNGRFFLHVSRAVAFNMVAAGCVNNDGLLNVNADSTILWTLSGLYNSTGSFITSVANVSGAYSFNSLPEGDYTVALSFNGFYVASQQLHVNGDYVIANIQPMSATAFINQQIAFYSTATNTTSYIWNFGDGSQITGVANPTFEYYQAGVFTVVMICSNDSGCTHTDSVTITVAGATGINNVASETRNIWAYAKTINIVLNEDIMSGAEVKIYNLLGQQAYAGSIDNQTTVITLNNEPNGYYIVNMQNNNVTSSKRIMLIN